MKSGSKATAIPATEAQQQTGVRFQMEMVVKEDVVVPFGPNGQTVGMMLDQQLASLAINGGEPRSFTFSFDDDSWKQAKPLYEAIASCNSNFFNAVEENLRYAQEDFQRSQN